MYGLRPTRFQPSHPRLFAFLTDIVSSRDKSCLLSPVPAVPLAGDCELSREAGERGLNFFRLEKLTFLISKVSDVTSRLISSEGFLWDLPALMSLFSGTWPGSTTRLLASMLLDSAAAGQLPPGNGHCPTPASSCAREFFGGGWISLRPKPYQWFLKHLNNTDCHIPVSRHISWPWLKYHCEFTCNGLQGKAEAGGEIFTAPSA